MATFNFTNGFKTIAPQITTAVDYALADGEKLPVVRITASAASKTVTLGLANGETMIVVNNGDTNAFTVKNISSDTGTSVATGKVVLCVGGSATADTFVAYVLN